MSEQIHVRKPHIRLSRRGWILVAVAGALLSSFAADGVASIGRIRSGVLVGSLELGGRTRAEAERLLTRQAERIASAEARFEVPGESVAIKPEQVGFFPDVDATVARALLVGRDGNLLARLWQRFLTYFVDTDIGWTSQIDRKAADALVAGWAERFDRPSQEAGIRAEGTEIVAVAGRTGRTMHRARARTAVVDGLESWPRREVPLPFRTSRSRTDLEDAEAAAERADELIREPITLTGPDGGELALSRADLAPLLEAVPHRRLGSWGLRVRFSPQRVNELLGPRMAPFEREARSATFRAGGGAVSVVPGQEGLKFDPEKTAEALTKVAEEAPPRRIAAAMTTSEPELTTEEAEALNIKERVSTFTTNHPCCQPRVKNIHRIADIIDGTIIRPGEVFSLNQAAGKRTTDRGFVLAPMIYDGEYKDDVGGGVSQFATTFYNAVFFGGYDIVSYKAHSYYISRYPPGREATISWPAPDLRFRNDSGAGILVKTGYSSTSITVSFYGDDGGKTVRAEAGERTNFTDPPEQRKPNPALAPGRERVAQSGSRGFDIVVHRIITNADGKTSRERYFTRYKPEPRIIEYGPGTPAPTPPPSTPAPTPRATPAPTPAPTPTPSAGGAAQKP